VLSCLRGYRLFYGDSNLSSNNVTICPCVSSGCHASCGRTAGPRHDAHRFMRAKGGRSRSVSHFDVAPARALLGDDSRRAIGHACTLASSRLLSTCWFFIAIAQTLNVACEALMAQHAGRQRRLAGDNQIQPPPVHHDFHFRLGVHARDFLIHRRTAC